MIRTHDGGGINGSGAGDIDGVGRSRIFANLSADPTVAASYNFGPSDTMINDMVATGAEVYFRVGRSNLTGTGQATPPPDFAKYAQIVQHVIMHYNQGWDNGFSLGIRYFEIWNRARLHSLLDGDRSPVLRPLQDDRPRHQGHG